jgi:hypothetical protein
MLHVELNGSTVLVSLAIYCKLATYAVFRPRSRELLFSLRVRAVEYAKELGMGYRLLSLVLPGTLALALHVLDHEVACWDALGGRLGKRTVELSGELNAGAVPPFYLGGSKLLSWLVGGRTERVVYPQGAA